MTGIESLLSLMQDEQQKAYLFGLCIKEDGRHCTLLFPQLEKHLIKTLCLPRSNAYKSVIVIFIIREYKSQFLTFMQAGRQASKQATKKDGRININPLFLQENRFSDFLPLKRGSKKKMYKFIRLLLPFIHSFIHSAAWSCCCATRPAET